MKLRDFKLGQQVKIKYHVSAIQAIEVECKLIRSEDDRICFHFPNKDLDLAKYFQEGNEIEVSLITRMGPRTYDSIVLYSPLEDEFTVEYYDDISKEQRRQYIRTDLICDLMLYKDKETLKTETINISGGGLRFIAKQDFTIGDIWEFSLYIPKRHASVRGSGEVIHMFKRENNSNFAVIEFQHIKEMERSRIIRAGFEAEAEEIKKQR